MKRGFSIHVREADEDLCKKLKMAQKEVDLVLQERGSGEFWKTTLAANTGIYRLALYRAFSLMYVYALPKISFPSSSPFSPFLLTMFH